MTSKNVGQTIVFRGLSGVLVSRNDGISPSPNRQTTEGDRLSHIFIGLGVRVVCMLFLVVLSLPAATFYVTVAGLGGEPDYEQRFIMLANDIDKTLKAGGAERQVETLKGPAATKANIQAALDKVARESKAQDALVLMLIGHGSYDGTDYKINLPGPDLSATELANLLNRIPATRQLVVNMTSASGGSIDALRKENRVIISATKTGSEKNATVFARYWVEALRDPAADVDKNDTVSALEAFRYAQQKTTKFYEEQKRLATEHSVIEDTGKSAAVRAPSGENGSGLRAAAFPLVRFGTSAVAASDPAKKALLAKKEDLEAQIDHLKYQKTITDPAQYKTQLSALLLELAKTQEELEK